VSVDDWFLTASERGNDATRLRPWTDGNAAEPLLHGSEYFPRLARALAAAGDGDLVLFADWRGDPDQLLTDDGVTVGGALAAASLRGALVKGLVWRSHLDRLRFSAQENRDLASDLRDDGAEVLLDQRVRPLGSHHQKFVVIRYTDRPADDVAFVGGIDLGHSRRDDDATPATGRPSGSPRPTVRPPPGTTCRWSCAGPSCARSRPCSGSAGRTRRR
jgi:phosphatidylserine/phosphatidylglycerophosphate/cardiolipin synthase-like enzyme